MSSSGREPAWLPVASARKMLKVSRQRVYALIEVGALVGRKVDGTVLVSAASVMARISMLEEEADRSVAGG